MQRHRRKPLLPADHVRDLHQVIVDHIGQVIGGHSVTLEKHLVVELVAVELDVTPDQVGLFDHQILRHFKADHMRFAGSQQGRTRTSRQGQRIFESLAGEIVVGKGSAVHLCIGAQGIQLFGRIEGIIGVAGVDQLLCIAGIELLAFALAVGSVRPSFAGTLVDFDSAPVERFHDVVLGSRYVAGLVGIFDSQQEIPAVVFGKKIVKKGGAHPSDVKWSGRTRGKTDADFGRSHMNML